MDNLVQSTPFMPPVAATMQSHQIFVFGDLARPFEEDLRQLLHVKGNENLRSFFEQFGFSFREECGKLPASQQDWFPRFTTLIDLLSKLGETEGTPVLRFTLFCVCEIGQFIRYFGEAARPYPSAANSSLLGICTGGFAAAAISTSRTLSELIPAGIEAALIAFRTALRSLEVRNDIEKPTSEVNRSWSLVVSEREAQIAALIETYSQAKGLPRSSKPYLSAITTTNVTISGPPSVLRDLLDSASLKPYHLPIESPYHAPHLFGQSDVDEIVGQFRDKALKSYKPWFTLLSSASGRLIAAESFKELLHEVVFDTLCEKPTIPTGKFEHSKIAIIGFSGRFPESASNEEFWELLHAGRDVHRTIPEDRFNWKTHFDPTGKTKNTSRIQYGCFINEPGLFDARFFNMSPRESENTDPAQRLAITATYEALEMAGMVPNRTPSTQQDRIGVFFGVTSDDWREVNSGQNVDTYFIPGGNRAFVPGRIRADAVGAVILKRLEDAQADNDPIFGVIAGANTNHCGQTDSITRPHEGDQASVFKRIIRYANVNPLDISYVEMHGTGTQAGDATEMNSVLSVFVPGRERMPLYPLYLGSAKANIGHAESASGVSSLIKVLMMMKNNEIPPHCGIKTKINHNYPLDLKERNVNIAFKPVPWRRTDSRSGKRTVFLNNFSAAGGNTAVLLEDAPYPQSDATEEDPRTTHLVTVTAKTLKSLQGNINALISFLEKSPGTSLPALSYTSTARRMQHNYRTICSGSDVKSIVDALRKREKTPDVKPIPSSTKLPKVVFAFTGQGSLYAGIGKQLFDSVSHFKADVLRFDSIAKREGFPSFLAVVDGSVANIEDVEPVVAHLALTCIQMALFRLWISWGVIPCSTIGHSLGEYAALYAAGVLTASDTIYLVGTRAQLLSKHCKKGTHAMLVVKATLDEIKHSLNASPCEIACINQPTSNVISGPGKEISRLANVDPILEPFEAAANGIRFSAPSIPFISPLLERVVSDAHTLGSSYLTQACRSAVNFEGALKAAKASVLVDEKTLWVEIGSHPACSGMIKGTLGPQTVTISSLRRGTDTWKVLAGGIESLYLNGIEIQWNEYHRDFTASHKVLELPRYCWDLKNYWIPYRNDFCLTKGDNLEPKQIAAPPVVQKPQPVYISPSVQRVIEEHNAPGISSLLVESDIHDSRLAPVIQGHKVNGAALCPSSLYADIAFTMTNYMLKKNNMQSDTTGLDVADMKVEKPLIALPNSGTQLLRASASADWSSKVVSIAFYSKDAQGRETTHATCQVRITANQTWLQDWARSSFLVRSRVASLHKGVDEGEVHKMKRGIVYKLFASLVDYNSKYQGMQEVVLDSSELEATAKVSFQAEDEGFYFNPCWIDSLGHIAGFIMNGNDNVQSKNQVFVNHGWDAMRCATKFTKGKTYQSYNKMQLASGTMYVGDTYILEEGKIVAIFEGVKFQGVPRQVLDYLLPSKPGVARSVVRPSSTVVTTAHPPTQAKPTPAAKSVVSSNAKPARSSPTSTNLSKVMAIISEEAGIELGELGPSLAFADYGIDSLLSLTISGRLQEELGLSLPSSLFADCPTVQDLTKFLAGSENPAPSSVSSSYDELLPTPEQDTASELTSETCSTSSTEITDVENVIDIIRATIAEETGTAVEDLTPSTSFREIGIDSLLALTVMGKLDEVLDMELSRNLFLDNDTLHEVEKTLGLTPKGSYGKRNNIVAALELPPQAADAPPHATSILLQGNPKTATKVLFLFPDGSGSATSYASLPKVSSDIVIYGLNCPWMKTPQDMKCSLEQLTAKYLVEIRRRQPKGPYYFGGWSAGGICAYEAAQQLVRDGEKTARLILIDSPNPVGLENPPQRMYDFFESLDFFGTNGRAPPSWLRPHFNAFISTLDNYKVKAFAGPPLETHLVYARDGICKYPSDPRPKIRPDDPREMLWLLNNRTDFSGRGWDELVGAQNLKIQVLDDVNHFSMMAPGPKIQDLSIFIRRAME
ncbi:hypothetical protein VTN00DRAFT_5062 [Thermoascus crustaceus]|uniref:uncharacterized protein n=1 Tax=Thermoascus crustaceus TaxID=5088 RepID=UPI003742E051